MKRLKIVEQIIIVLVVAVLIPLITIGIIISNISQQSVRNELKNTAYLMANFVGDSVQNYIEVSQSQLNQIASSFGYISKTIDKVQYFDDIESKTKLFTNIDIVKKKELPKDYEFKDGKITLYSSIDGTYYLTAQININIIDTLIGKENVKNRNIYIFNTQTDEIIATNSKDTPPRDILNYLKIKNNEETGLFGKKKNIPKAFYKLNNPKWIVIVDTTKKVTNETIIKAKSKIILSLCLAALSILIIAGLYTYYLYINIRQLFKGITAISKGNYDKKIHLIKSPFTPNETVFIAKEFNYMANKIKHSYKDLKEKNLKLEKLNEFRENLVNATSHEFRTPLTSIIGYSSRLLRKDIVLDDEMKIKSLQIIKEQAQRLSTMVEDLLVIPELESYSLKFNIEKVDLINSITKVIEYQSTKDAQFDVDLDKNTGLVWADEYRLEQILMNLIDNAIKYNIQNEPIKIRTYKKRKTPFFEISNKCEKISQEIQEKIFEKFIRADSKLTRTTRGTGLGLYIVKGLAQNMKIDIIFTCNTEFKMTLKFNDYVK